MASRFWVTQPISAIVDNGSGKCRCTVTSTTGMTTGDVRTFFNVAGTAALNGAQTITVIDSTHVDITAVAFSATGTGSINGKWDATNANNWVSTTGGTNYGQTVPGSADDATFDASSGGGTVTIATNITIANFISGAFTGTIDFSTNNNNYTGKTFKSNGTGARTINLGSGTFTLTDIGGAVLDFGVATNLTLNTGTCIIKCAPSAAGNDFHTLTFPQESVVNSGAGVTWSNVVIDGASAGSNPGVVKITAGGGPLHITNFTLQNHAPTIVLNYQGGASQVVIGTSFTCPSSQGGASALGAIGGVSNWSLPNGTALNFLAIQGCTFTGTSLTATNSFDLGGNSNITISGPAGSSGSRMIGG